MSVYALPREPAEIFVFFITAGIAVMSLTHHALGAEKVGVADEIRNNVTAFAKDKARKLEKASPVYRKEKVSTDQDSSVTLIFLDETKLTLGPGASVTLDDLVFSKKSNSARRYVISVLQGAFRFASGLSEKSIYKIRTPAATIGIRGTVLDLYVGADGTTGVLLQDGGLRACGKSGFCTTLTEACQFARVDPDGRVRRRRRPSFLPFDAVSHDMAFPFDESCSGDGGSGGDGTGGNGNGGGDGGGGDGGDGGGVQNPDLPQARKPPP